MSIYTEEIINKNKIILLICIYDLVDGWKITLDRQSKISISLFYVANRKSARIRE